MRKPNDKKEDIMKEILNGTAYKESFEHVTQKYNELVKKRRR